MTDKFNRASLDTVQPVKFVDQNATEMWRFDINGGL